nr:unnamed protein product [Digitaria exilis]
MIHHACHR